jgi:hypothetical protein
LTAGLTGLPIMLLLVSQPVLVAGTMVADSVVTGSMVTGTTAVLPPGLAGGHAASPATTEQEEVQEGELEMDLVPARKRFVIEYPDDSEEQYFRILEYFGIYLGAVKRSRDEIIFLENPNSEEPQVSTGTRKSEKALVLHIRNMDSPFREWDEARMKKHGVDLAGALPERFYPAETEKLLTDLEAGKLKEEGRTLSDVYQTRFGCRATDDGFEYFVIGIDYK